MEPDMNSLFELSAELRPAAGKSAARRLRRTAKIPAILYGGREPPLQLALDEASLMKQSGSEAFYSHVLTLKLGDRIEQVVLKDLQRHPYRPQILHVDLQRVTATERIQVHVPLHFVGQEVAPGVKEQGGVVTHHIVDVAVSCLPGDLPEFIEVDVSQLRAGDVLHLSDLALPPGVALVAHGSELSAPVATIQHARGVAETGGVAAVGEPESGGAPAV
jgi:large subunit ribosomal protein L25